jgi:hypothetical protein
MKDQPVEKREFVRVLHCSIRVLNLRIAGDTPLFVADNSSTVFALRLGVVLAAVIPAG